jgi:hypothetical protein
VEEFPRDLKIKGKGAWNENLIKIDENALLLDEKRSQNIPHIVMKGMFLSKRGRQDIQPGISFLSTRVKNPSQNDWLKLSKIIKF